MLPARIFSKCIRSQITLPFQWLSITVRLDSSSTSSSDSSSDSDSDNEKQKRKTQRIEDKSSTPKIGENDLEQLLSTMMNKANPPSKRLDVAVQPRKKQKNINKKNIDKPFETKLTAAAENVAEAFGKDKEKVTSELLRKLLNVEKKDTVAKPLHINNVLSNMLEQKTTRFTRSQTRSQIQSKPWTKKKSIIHELAEQEKTKFSLSKKQDNYRKRLDENVITTKENKLFFHKIAEPSPNMPELKIWNFLEEKELQSLVTQSPKNVFQELIMWTEEGKLWKFPIDNEQGMEEEQNVHFSEHVFIERHLKGWCPTKGPIRYFMELVCVGLSKNAFMTVQEKIEHIMWFKEYFEDKKNLLVELGAIEPELTNTPKQIET